MVSRACLTTVRATLTSMFERRRWSVDARRSRDADERHAFRFVGTTHDGHVVVALFADYTANDARRLVAEAQATDPPTTIARVPVAAPSYKTLGAVAQLARYEYGDAHRPNEPVYVLLLLSNVASLPDAISSSLVLMANAERTLRVEAWCVDELAFDLMRHEWVPTYRALTPSERARYANEKLSTLLVTDPVARWLRLERDSLVVEEYDTVSAGRIKLVLRVA